VRLETERRCLFDHELHGCDREHVTPYVAPSGRFSSLRRERWNLIDANRAASLLWDGVDPALLSPPINMLRLAVHPRGLPTNSSMTAACNASLIHRLKRKSREDCDELADGRSGADCLAA